MSLSLLNEHNTELDEDHAALLKKAWGPARICTVVEQNYENERLRDLYTALGTRIHPGKRDITHELLTEALVESGLPTDLADAANDSSLDDALRKRHATSTSLVGNNVGTPIMHITDDANNTRGIFGPVVVPTPRGDQAGRMFDAVTTLVGFDNFFELKRTCTRTPDFSS